MGRWNGYFKRFKNKDLAYKFIDFIINEKIWQKLEIQLDMQFLIQFLKNILTRKWCQIM